MDFKEILKAVKRNDFAYFSLNNYGQTGEVTSKDIYTVSKVSFFVVQEFRWVSSIATGEYPALLPGIITCLPTLITNKKRKFLVHVFHPSGIEQVVNALFHPAPTCDLAISTFAAEKSGVTGQVQRWQQTELTREMKHMGVAADSIHAHKLQRFRSVIFYNEMLSFFNGRNQLVYQHPTEEG